MALLVPHKILGTVGEVNDVMDVQVDPVINTEDEPHVDEIIVDCINVIVLDSVVLSLASINVKVTDHIQEIISPKIVAWVIPSTLDDTDHVIINNVVVVTVVVYEPYALDLVSHGVEVVSWAKVAGMENVYGYA